MKNLTENLTRREIVWLGAWYATAMLGDEPEVSTSCADQCLEAFDKRFPTWFDTDEIKKESKK